MDEQIRAKAGEVRGHLRINAPTSFGQIVIAPRLPGFMERYPDLSITLSFDDRVVDMVEQGFDPSVRIRATLPDSALFARPITCVKQRLFCGARKRHRHIAGLCG